MTEAPNSLRARALRWLAQREHSRSELRDKLLRLAAVDGDRQALAAAVDALLDALAASGHLSDERFVESRIHARAARHGNRRIEAELARHGLRADESTRAALRATELARASEVWRRRFAQLPADAGERARQTRFLAARGFGAETIRQLLAGADDD